MGDYFDGGEWNKLLSMAQGAERMPLEGERQFFRKNPNVGGMATDDGRLIINQLSTLAPQEQDAVRVNELIRLFMRSDPQNQPAFNMTPQQTKTFGAYGPPEDQRQTIVARMLTGDQSAGATTPHQRLWANHIARRLAESR